MTRSILAIALLMVAVGCANNTATVESQNVMFTGGGDVDQSSTEDFDVIVDQLSAPMAMPTSQNDRTPVAPLDVTYGITITNHTKEEVTVKRIAVSTPPGPFTIPLMQRNYKTAIAAGTTQKLDFWATGKARDANAGAMVPTVLRTRITFTTPDGKDRTETFLRRINGAVTVTAG